MAAVEMATGEGVAVVSMAVSIHPRAVAIGTKAFLDFLNRGDNMNRTLISALFVVSLLTACVVVPGGRHGGPVLVPLLPPLVMLDAEPYYFQGGFHYHYNNGSWLYSTSRSGPWIDLPRGHYPKEVRFRGKDDQRGRGRDHDDHDNRRR